MNFNQVLAAGNLTRDPEVRYTPKGTAVANFGIAVNRTYFNERQEKLQETTFLDLTAWGATAENIAKHFRRGSPIFIKGRLKTETWDDQRTGAKRSKLIVVVEEFYFTERKRTEDDAPPSATQQQRQAPPRQQQPPAASDFGDGPITDGMDDDIPF